MDYISRKETYNPEERAKAFGSQIQFVVEGLAALILENNQRKGRTIEIPSLGIKIPPDKD
ncbi:MAG: hypothetical protein KKF68_00195 [Nanoarchaeota archaeon]|nr:hypothetical protein [Nanoarchaeota archaeon]